MPRLWAANKENMVKEIKVQIKVKKRLIEEAAVPFAADLSEAVSPSEYPVLGWKITLLGVNKETRHLFGLRLQLKYYLGQPELLSCLG